MDANSQHQQSSDPSSTGNNSTTNDNAAAAASLDDQHMMESFHQQLKELKVVSWDPNCGKPFPEEAGGATGLNTALSAGLQLLSRYRLHSRFTENFGMGRLPNPSILTGNNVATSATSALQPACLVVLTDGACLRQSPKLGGGALQLQYGAQPLKEFYTEPFRWDQRIFCIGVGGREGVTSTQYIHPQLRALCEVTGGSHWLIHKAASSNLSEVTAALMKRISPPVPREIPPSDPLGTRIPGAMIPKPVKTTPGISFIHGGPLVILQALEPDEIEGGQHRPSKPRRAMLLYVGSMSTAVSPMAAPSHGDTKPILSPPLWCIPEAHFPNKKLDTLPPRKAQPYLIFSRYPSNLGIKSFEPMQVIKQLQKLDSLTLSNRKGANALQPKCLHRDTYVCEWVNPEGGKQPQVTLPGRQEFFPVFCPGAGRPSLAAEDIDNYLNIGILHIPANGSSSLATSSSTNRLATLTLLPPDPHILLPLLIRAAEAENRVIKKLEGKGSLGKTMKVNIPLDENWRNEIHAYLFRIPPYYHQALRRALRPILPTSANNLLQLDTTPDSIIQQCFSKVCLQKIKNGEQIAKDNIERLERQEMSFRSKPGGVKPLTLRYGQFDPRGSLDNYLAALRNMPPPWRNGLAHTQQDSEKSQEAASNKKKKETGQESPRSVLDLIGDLPTSGLMAFYESRRRWIFGGTGLTTRGLHVKGVNYDGSNSQRCDSTPSQQPQCPLSLAGVGVSTVNETSTTKMGDYRERLLFSNPPIVGYGSNDYAGVAATTAVDGSPKWSVDNDAMPMAFFDPVNGEFEDSVQARVRSRLMVNFGNPYKEKRADSLVPEKFSSHAPSLARGLSETGSSPPHDSFDSVEEGEAVFVLKSPTRTSPSRDDDDESSIGSQPSKKQRTAESESTQETKEKPPPPPVPTGNSSTDRVGNQTSRPPPPKPPSTGIPPPPKPPASHPSSPGSPALPPSQKHSAASTVGSVPPPPKPPSTSSTPSGTSANPPPPKPPPGNQSSKNPKGTQKTVIPPPPPPPPGKLSAHGSGTIPRPAGAAKSSTTAKRPAPPKPPPQRSTKPPPPPPKPPTSGTTQTPTQSTESPSNQELQRPDVKPQVDLPAGWICVWSKSQKRWYFFNTKNNQSVWQWPPTKL